jgi:hypothetical protein
MSAMINTMGITGARKKLQENRRNEDEDQSMKEYGKMELHYMDRLAEMAHSRHVCVQANFV